MELADQIRARWGKYGDWQSAGQDQAADLARLLEANGISDLSKLNVTQKEFDVGPQTNVLTGFVGDNEQYGDVEAYKYKAPVFQYDGRELGFLGDVNKDGSLSRVGDQQHLGYDGGQDMGVANDKLAAWSSRGGGHTNFQLVPDSSGGFAIAPVWESSKADDLYGAKMAALFALGGYGAAAGAGTGMGAAIGQGAATGAYTGVASSAFTGADPLKAGYGGLVTGALTGGVKGLGQTQGWSPATTRAVSGGTNALMRGGSGEDILKGAATGYVTGGGVGDILKGSDLQGTNLGGNMDFGNYDFGNYDFSTSDNYFGDSFGNSATDFSSSFDPSIYDFGVAMDGSGGIDWTKLLLKGGGAALGYMDSKDKEQTSTRDPWAPAQDFLKQQIGTGQQLAAQFQAQPFSQAQQTAYGNMGGLLDAINAQAAGGLIGASANASGMNNYDRSNPRRQLTGSTGFDLSRWAPGLLGNFGTTGGK